MLTDNHVYDDPLRSEASGLFPTIEVKTVLRDTICDFDKGIFRKV